MTVIMMMMMMMMIILMAVTMTMAMAITVVNGHEDNDYYNSRELKQLRRRPQRRPQKTIGLMIKTTALHVHHAF